MKKCNLEILKIIEKANSGQPVGIITINNRLSDDCFDELITKSRKTLSAILNDLIETEYIVNCGDRIGFCLTEKGKAYLISILRPC